jgi:hypothetical protein
MNLGITRHLATVEGRRIAVLGSTLVAEPSIAVAPFRAFACVAGRWRASLVKPLFELAGPW